jgi:SulP family sulfate permease
MIAILESFHAGLLKRQNLYSNIMAGVIVGIVALPLAMAFAIASGVKPEQGLYTAIIAGIMVGLFGGSRVQIAGPTGAFIVILANITAQHGVIGLQIATLMAGVILILMGLIRLGNVIKFIPDPVIVGFTAGIGVIIFVGEWKDFLGLNIHLPINAHFYEKLFFLLQALPSLNLATTFMALLSISLVLITPKVVKRIPGPLVAMVVATLLQGIFHFKHIATIGSAFGAIPQHLPVLQLPSTSLNNTLDLIGPAFTIALLGAIESLLSATAADGMAGTKHNSNQELIGQGLANIFAPLFGGFAATGAIARTATNIRNGGNSPIAAVIHSIILILIIVLLAPLTAYIPLCTLAAILFVVAYNMSDISHFIYLLKLAPRYDKFVLLTTFLLTIFTDLVVAVNVGIILAMMFFIQRMSQSIIVEQQEEKFLKRELSMDESADLLPTNTFVYLIQGPFFFGAAEKIEHALQITNTDPKTIIFRLKYVPFMDITGLQTFKETLENFHKRGIKIYLCEANLRVKHKLRNLGLLNSVVSKKIYPSLQQVFTAVRDQTIIT